MDADEWTYGRCSKCGWRGYVESGCGADCYCEEEGPEAEDLDTCDAYEETFSHQAIHVARKIHHHETTDIMPGDTYRRTVRGGYIRACREYPAGGPRWLVVVKHLIKRAEPMEIW